MIVGVHEQCLARRLGHREEGRNPLRRALAAISFSSLFFCLTMTAPVSALADHMTDDRPSAPVIGASDLGHDDFNVGVTEGDLDEDFYCEKHDAQLNATVWARYTATATGIAIFTASSRQRFIYYDGSGNQVVRDVDLAIQVYRGDEKSPLDCSDDGGDTTVDPLLSVDVTAGQTYFVQVGSYCCYQDVIYDEFGTYVTGPAYWITGRFNYRVRLVIPDRDRDGYSLSSDCNDSNASIHPNARDIPHNSIDENCVGGDNKDGDNDGIAAHPFGGDCNDSNPGISSRAAEVRGNFVDENCDGRAVAAQLQPFPVVAVTYRTSRRGTSFRRLKVSGVRRGYRVRVTCKGRGRGCRRSQRKTAGASRPLTFRLPRFLRAGGKIEIYITRPDQNVIGKYTKYTARRGKPPKRIDRCLFPGALNRPRAC